ncbi:MAG: serine O-acetyltransferase [Clostridiales bacterium]|jgi:serine O-acetyltransferase|nr:serine O-acetyltransferase [Clostridiales bacterium]
MKKGILHDLRSIRERDPAARSCLEIVLLYSGFHALIFYRISHALYKIRLKFLARFVSQLGRLLTGIEIHPGAKIGRGLFIDHGMGVVIGETTEIGDYCTIFQGVTLGGTGKDTGKRHPTIGDEVLIGAGAKVLGPFTVGDRARIAANAVVLSEVPPDSTVVGVPGRIVRIKGERVPNLDHVHIPDPVAQEICRLRIRIENLEKTQNIEVPDILQSKVRGCDELEESSNKVETT